MQIANRLGSTGTGDGLSNLAGRAAAQVTSGSREEGNAAVSPAGSYDPSSRVSLSIEALLFLGRTKRVQEKYPALTAEEWGNKLSPQLAAREYQAFGKYGETGDYKAYYRAFIEYYDNLRPEDQNSLRYFGTREAALAGARSVEYSDESGGEGGAAFQTLVSVLLDTDKPQSEFSTSEDAGGMITGDMFGWDSGTIIYEEVSQTRGALSEVERLYQENF
jgi:hypothetical protein